jgi:hypothetical protein
MRSGPRHVSRGEPFPAVDSSNRPTRSMHSRFTLPNMPTNQARQPQRLSPVRFGWMAYQQVAAILGAFALIALISHVAPLRWRSFLRALVDQWNDYVRPATRWLFDLLISTPLSWYDVRFELPLAVRDYLSVGMVFLLAAARARAPAVTDNLAGILLSAAVERNHERALIVYTRATARLVASATSWILLWPWQLLQNLLAIVRYRPQWWTRTGHAVYILRRNRNPRTLFVTKHPDPWRTFYHRESNFAGSRRTNVMLSLLPLFYVGLLVALNYVML